MVYYIIPYESVGNLGFHMTRDDVTALLGPPGKSKKSRFSNEITNSWFENNLQIAFDLESQKLLEISIYSGLKDVFFEDINIFGNNPNEVIRRLIEKDKNPKEKVGVKVFLRLGVALSGFSHEDGDDRSITIFTKDRWTPAELE